MKHSFCQNGFEVRETAKAAPVNKIIPLSTVDGFGARTAVFLQGCNIACAYCHNPETQRLCSCCGACVAGCPAGALFMAEGKTVWNREKCVGCDACLAACPCFASPKVTRMTAAEVMDAVELNLPFIRGLTVSGGECTLYPDFLTELFTLARARNLTCLIDSNGTADFSAWPNLMAVTSGVMLDVKAWDPAVYRALTGGAGNAVVKRNLAYLQQTGRLTEVRVVYMPGRVDAEAAVEGIAGAVGPGRETLKLKLIAFRPHGTRGGAETARVPAPQEMQALRAAAQKAGFANIQVV